MQPIIELKGIAKTFGSYVAVSGVDLQIEEGCFMTLLGASGSGKTTTLRLIAGLEMPSAGSIHYRGADITDVPVTERDMRMVFQDYALFPNMTVSDNVAFGMRLRRARGRYAAGEIEARVRRYLELVRLSDHATKYPGQLSGGQKQRVALARALVTDPKVVLFDEPLGSLDANLRKLMQFELKRMHRELGMTFVYVTHDQDEAMAMSDRIAVMQNARLLQVGTPEQVYEEPVSMAVARFIGAANVVEGTLDAHAGKDAAVRLADGTLVRVPLRGQEARPGDRVLLMMRAERFLFDRSRAPQEASWLRGKVIERLYLGKKMEYQVELPQSGGVISVLDGEFEGRPVAVDQVLEFGIAPGHVRLLAH